MDTDHNPDEFKTSKLPPPPLNAASHDKGASPKRVEAKAEETLQNTTNAFIIVLVAIIFMLALTLVFIWALAF
jgi:hypothetical protein